MRSGDPDPIEDLMLLLDAKKHGPFRTLEIVSEAARWLKGSLKGADVGFSYASCEERNHYGFATLTIIRRHRDEPVCLELKIAEIGGVPYIFAEIRSLGKFQGTLFPFFGEIRSDEGRNLLLHYVADFVLSTEA